MVYSWRAVLGCTLTVGVSGTTTEGRRTASGVEANLFVFALVTEALAVVAGVVVVVVSVLEALPVGGRESCGALLCSLALDNSDWRREDEGVFVLRGIGAKAASPSSNIIVTLPPAPMREEPGPDRLLHVTGSVASLMRRL